MPRGPTPSPRPEDIPAYSLGEAAALVGVPASALRAWARGRAFPRKGGVGRSQAVLLLPPGPERFLSFTNLVEAHVLASMRRRYALKLEAIRRAVRFVREQLGVDHPLAVERFKTNGVDLFVERLDLLMAASRDGQVAMKNVLGASLERVEYDDSGRAVRLFPLFRRGDAPRHVVVDPSRAFGRPVLVGTSVPIRDIRSRFNVGESVGELAADYDVAPEMIEEALRASPQAA